MTDIISNIKIQKPVPIRNRRVSIQQSANYDQQIKSVQYHNSPANCYAPTKQHESLLKSSLKSTGNIPTMVKSVRFNMPLVQILHYNVPSVTEEEETYDGFEEDEDDDYFGNDQEDQDEEEENELEDAFLELFSKRLSSSCSDPILYQINGSDPSILDMKLTNWPVANPSERSISQVVTLESLDWDHARSIIKGRVLVRNLAFEKIVTVRMSFNHWQTWIDVDARYEAASENAAFDRFSFELVTPNHLSYMNLINSGSHCSLAVKYQVDGAEYWDNNSGNDFLMQWLPPCGYSAFLGDKQGNDTSSFSTTIPTLVVNQGSQVPSLLLLEQQRQLEDQKRLEQQIKCPIPSMLLYQEDPMQLKKEEYTTLISDNYLDCCNHLYIDPPISRYENQDLSDGAFGLTTQKQQHQQNQISTDFQYYLDRKKCSNMYIDPLFTAGYKKQDLYDDAFGISTQKQQQQLKHQQNQMSTDFQYYLDRKKCSNMYIDPLSTARYEKQGLSDDAFGISTQQEQQHHHQQQQQRHQQQQEVQFSTDFQYYLDRKKCNMYMDPISIARYEKQGLSNDAFGFTRHQQLNHRQNQIGTDFNYYLDRKKWTQYKVDTFDQPMIQKQEENQIHTDFEYYLDRNYQQEYRYMHLPSVTDHDEGPMPYSLTPSSLLLIPPNKNGLMIT